MSIYITFIFIYIYTLSSSGLSVMVLAFILTLTVNVNLQGSSQPRWLCVYTGVAVLIYQTLDNMDGKQVRHGGICILYVCVYIRLFFFFTTTFF